MLKLEVFVSEFGSIDGLSSSPVVICEISTLAHKVWDDSVECGGLETESLLSGAQRAEVLSGLGHNIVAELRFKFMLFSGKWQRLI